MCKRVIVVGDGGFAENTDESGRALVLGLKLTCSEGRTRLYDQPPARALQRICISLASWVAFRKANCSSWFGWLQVEHLLAVCHRVVVLA